jgi:hypothetical protein
MMSRPTEDELVQSVTHPIIGSGTPTETAPEQLVPPPRYEVNLRRA